MSKVRLISGRGIPLVGNDIDTDRIIPARFLRSVSFDGLGEQVFADDRTQAQGQHPFDQPQYQGAKILVVNSNFGCGSSREHAPQALAKWGIQAIFGESFSEIFFGNCVAIGMACVTAKETTLKHLHLALVETPLTPMTVDLEAMKVRFEDFCTAVSIGEGSRQMLIKGTWDDCGQLVTQVNQIRATASKLPYLDWTKV